MSRWNDFNVGERRDFDGNVMNYFFSFLRRWKKKELDRGRRWGVGGVFGYLFPARRSDVHCTRDETRATLVCFIDKVRKLTRLFLERLQHGHNRGKGQIERFNRLNLYHNIYKLQKSRNKPM